ncbi:MAG: gamma-butyrobetaine hydroxylase family protein [Acidiferrobacterales bacterium]
MRKNVARPTDIKLHQKSHVLEVTFDDASHFRFPCEYLRAFSPSAEVRGHGPGQEVLQIGKENVNITNIEPVGTYAVCLYFDDGHNTGIYSWDLLHNLGVNQQQLWGEYLQRLEKAGYKRNPKPVDGGVRR